MTAEKMEPSDMESTGLRVRVTALGLSYFKMESFKKGMTQKWDSFGASLHNRPADTLK